MMMNSHFRDKCHIVNELIDGIGPWLWPKEDWEGFKWPKEDWLNSHKEKWLAAVKNTSICVQAGGLCGMYPRLLSEYFDVVYTFEPEPLNFYCLVENCQKENIVKMQAALGKENKMIGIETSISHNRGMSHVIDGNQIPMLTIDSLNLPGCDLIQLDVEGYEADVLVGAAETISKFRPAISVERFWTDRIDPESILMDYGYQFLGKSAVLDYVYGYKI